MIVQSAKPGEKHFVITMEQHTAFSAQLAVAFGNDEFETIEPRSVMLHVIENHDAGWRELDAIAPRDPETGLPYNLVKTPFARIVETSSASPNFNGKTHPYCELLSSMHSWGLYNGRYGMSEKVLLDSLADENRIEADEMLGAEVSRQTKLKAALADNPETAGWVEEAHLLQNYKQLQLFDTMALYFNCFHEGNRGQDSFTHVPRSSTSDTTISIKELGDGKYGLHPFPFNDDNLEVNFNGRYILPASDDDKLGEVLSSAAVESQKVKLVRI